MSLEQGLFYFFSAVILGAAWLTVASRRIVHSAIYLFITLIFIGLIYFFLGSEFLAGMQVFIYAGAITVLLLFVVMLTAGEVEVRSDFLSWGKAVPLAAAAAFFLVIMRATSSVEWATQKPQAVPGTVELAGILFRRYVLPFELSAVILTIALVGAIILAREDKPDEEDPTAERLAGETLETDSLIEADK